MSIFGLFFTLINSILIFIFPRRWTSIPIIFCTCYMTYGQTIELGPLTFTVIRILIATGIVRAVVKRESPFGGLIFIDWLIFAWAAWAVISLLIRQDFSSEITSRLGLIYNVCGIYFLFRIFIGSYEDLSLIIRFLSILLLPLAIAMIYEKISGFNIFSIFGAVWKYSAHRSDIIRAQGPFSHSILAGTTAAICFPLIISQWSYFRKLTVIGIIASMVIVYASGSSGPMVCFITGIGTLILWKFKAYLRYFIWIAITFIIIINLLMKAPFYYLIARAGLQGGGWHRARLIESAIQHISEWWIAGTDYTRHWMPTGVPWSENHTDITNHFITYGVYGGLPLMLLFIYIIIKAFSYLNHISTIYNKKEPNNQFFFWTIGSALYVTIIAMLSVYFSDQSYIFIYLIIASIASIYAENIHNDKKEEIKLD